MPHRLLRGWVSPLLQLKRRPEVNYISDWNVFKSAARGPSLVAYRECAWDPFVHLIWVVVLDKAGSVKVHTCRLKLSPFYSFLSLSFVCFLHKSTPSFQSPTDMAAELTLALGHVALTIARWNKKSWWHPHDESLIIAQSNKQRVMKPKCVGTFY